GIPRSPRQVRGRRPNQTAKEGERPATSRRRGGCGHTKDCVGGQPVWPVPSAAAPQSARARSLRVTQERAVEGVCDPRFAAVREELARNLRERGEVGASVCVIVEGKAVVDLWGGVAERREQTPWGQDTIGVLWSCTKGLVAACAHLLVSRGLLDLDAPVVHYWPEFAAQGKESVTPRLILSHQAGLPAVRQPLP